VTAPAFEPSTTDNGSIRGPADFARALLNILEDYAAEQNELQDTQRAVLNVLDDSAYERRHFQDTQRAVLNVLEDSASERGLSQDTQRAVLNTLEDFAEEKRHLEEMKSAALNILEDLGTERDKLEEAQKQLATANEELKGSTVRLEQSNRELQDFTSVASHDLQEPLRKVQTFGDRLKTDYAAALDEQGQDYLDRMLNATKRMQSLIHDLLVFSRVGNKTRSFLPVDLAQVTREVLSDLEVRIAETNAHVEVGDLPTIDADAMQMRQLLQNLIGNALKFHQKGKPAAVRVYAETADLRPAAQEMFRLVVEDKGIGFDEKYLDRIFTVFQRLHSRAEYEGTGVGLAVCRKIAQRHGGDITATSTVGQGTAFLVALPRRHANGNAARIPGGRADMHIGIPVAANSSLASVDGEVS
jgi:signal transduction histidine kinase